METLFAVVVLSLVFWGIRKIRGPLPPPPPPTEEPEKTTEE